MTKQFTEREDPTTTRPRGRVKAIDEKKRYVRVSLYDDGHLMGSYVCERRAAHEELETLIQEGLTEEKLMFEIVEMDEAEYDALPEFTGF